MGTSSPSEDEFYDAVEDEEETTLQHRQSSDKDEDDIPDRSSSQASGKAPPQIKVIEEELDNLNFHEFIGKLDVPARSSSPRSEGSVSTQISVRRVEGEDIMPSLSHYQSSHGTIHPLADLNTKTPYAPSESPSEMTTETQSSRSSIGAMSVVLSEIKDGAKIKRIRIRAKKKIRSEFNQMFLIQELTTVSGGSTSASSTGSGNPVYAAKFSYDGNYLAIAGEDGVIKIWKLIVDDTMTMINEDKSYIPPRMAAIFQQEPIRLLNGHEGAVLDLNWSKNNFLLSASMDRTVRLWHYSRDDCLGVFRHPDFVTSVAFHPRDDRIFITGSLDCRLRLWSIADKSVRAWNELPTNNFVTAVAFNTSGKLALAGTSTGVCLVFETEILISTNDSRLRLYTLRDKSVISKFIGHVNESSQIRAAFSDDGEFVISGSEDNKVFIWNVENRYQRKSFFSRIPSQHVKACEYFEAHSKPISAVLFAPSTVCNRLQSVGLRPVMTNEMGEGMIVVATDLNGKVKVYENNSLLESWLSSI